MANEDIRHMIKESGLTQWKIAEYLNISEITLCRRLRKELDQKSKDEILAIINNYKQK